MRQRNLDAARAIYAEIGNAVAERFPSATLAAPNSQLATMVAAGEKLMTAVKATGADSRRSPGSGRFRPTGDAELS